jgi:hypothetical protein
MSRVLHMLGNVQMKRNTGEIERVSKTEKERA